MFHVQIALSNRIVIVLVLFFQICILGFNTVVLFIQIVIVLCIHICIISSNRFQSFCFVYPKCELSLVTCAVLPLNKNKPYNNKLYNNLKQSTKASDFYYILFTILKLYMLEPKQNLKNQTNLSMNANYIN
jgi:hypothetical protein